MLAKILVRIMVLLVALSAILVGTGDAKAATIKHHGWKRYSVCHGQKWKHQHPHRARCKSHLTRQYRIRRQVVRYAKSKIGHPYVWGGTGPWGFDCSGIIFAAYRSAHKPIPRTTFAQLAHMPRIHRKRRMGDLVFPSSHHVAVYIGHGRVVEARHTGTRLWITSSARFHWATRTPRF